jgi:uncharacterized protein (TIGR02246 family)
MRSALVLLALLLAGCAGPGGTGEDAGSPEKQVTRATAAWAAAYNSRDPGRIAAMYEPDAVLWGTSAKTIAPTPAAVTEYFKDADKRPDAYVVIGEHHVRVYGDVAFSSGYYTFNDTRDGKPVVSPSRFTMVFQRRNGEWRLVHHHSSRVPA